LGHDSPDCGEPITQFRSEQRPSRRRRG
jgi:hypothetical protein